MKFYIYKMELASVESEMQCAILDLEGLHSGLLRPSALALLKQTTVIGARQYPEVCYFSL